MAALDKGEILQATGETAMSWSEYPLSLGTGVANWVSLKIEKSHQIHCLSSVFHEKNALYYSTHLCTLTIFNPQNDRTVFPGWYKSIIININKHLYTLYFQVPNLFMISSGLAAVALPSAEARWISKREISSVRSPSRGRPWSLHICLAGQPESTVFTTQNATVFSQKSTKQCVPCLKLFRVHPCSSDVHPMFIRCSFDVHPMFIRCSSDSRLVLVVVGQCRSYG